MCTIKYVYCAQYVPYLSQIWNQYGFFMVLKEDFYAHWVAFIWSKYYKNGNAVKYYYIFK